MGIELLLGWAAWSVMLSSHTGWAALRPEKIHVADERKNQAYIDDGLIIGGDRNVQATIKDIRRSNNEGFERVVIDLDSTDPAENASIQRPPYYQIEVTPDEKRLVVTIWGQPKSDFNPKKVIAAFKRSAIMKDIVLLPRLEDPLWIFTFDLKSDVSVEAFELSKPPRVIMDVKLRKKFAATQSKNEG